MRFTSLLLIVLLATGLSFSQSLQLQNVGVPGQTDTLMISTVGSSPENFAQIKNVSSSAKTNCYCKRQVISMVSGNLNWFCWGITCYSPNQDSSTSAHVVSIAAGATSTAFYAYLSDASNSLLNDTVRYTVWDGNNPTDSVSWVVVYVFTTGINEVAIKSNLVNAFPDPSDNTSMIQYNLSKDAKSARIKVMNMLGNKVAEYQLDTRDSKFALPTNSLSPGIYFYSLEVDGNITSTKKLVVNR